MPSCVPVCRNAPIMQEERGNGKRPRGERSPRVEGPPLMGARAIPGGRISHPITLPQESEVRYVATQDDEGRARVRY